MSRIDHLNYKPNDHGIEAIKALRLAIINLDEVIEGSASACREKSLALTKLEECRMWAVKAIVVQNSLGVDEVA